LLRDGDGLINSTGVGTLGRTALFKKYAIGEYTVDSHVTIVRPKLEVLNPDYFGLVLKALENVFVSLSTGSSGQTELPREAVRETSITFPINLADQVDFYEYYSSINYALGDSIKLVAERRSLALYLRQSFLSSAFFQEEVVA
jgi:type I restriction enzyme S subunit